MRIRQINSNSLGKLVVFCDEMQRMRPTYKRRADGLYEWRPNPAIVCLVKENTPDDMNGRAFRIKDGSLIIGRRPNIDDLPDDVVEAQIYEIGRQNLLILESADKKMMTEEYGVEFLGRQTTKDCHTWYGGACCIHCGQNAVEDGDDEDGLCEACFLEAARGMADSDDGAGDRPGDDPGGDGDVVYCDDCGDPDATHPVSVLPVNVASANKGESAVLCEKCYAKVQEDDA